MNPYVKHLLSNNEVELSETHQHPFWLVRQVWPFIAMIIFLLLVFIFSDNVYKIFNNIFHGGVPNCGQGVNASGECLSGSNNIGWLALIVAIIPLAIIAVYYIRWRNHIYVVTNERVITLNGVVNKSTYDIALEKINDISTTQNLFGRMFNFGDVTLESGNDTPVLMHGIASPLEFKKSLLDAKSGMGVTPATSAGYRPVIATNPGVNPMVPPVVSAANGGGSASALRELEDLRSQGLITDAEYAQKRTQILQRM